jgi:nicotinamidase-related amidase
LNYTRLRDSRNTKKGLFLGITTLDPRTALILIDFENVFASLPLVPYTAPEVVARAAELASAFRGHDLPVVLVRFTQSFDGPVESRGRTEFGVTSGELPPPGWDEIVDELAGHPEDILITKSRWGAFYDTDLSAELQRRDITQVVLGGLTTSLAVDTTARTAHDHGQNVTLATDAMADLSLEAHEHCVERIFPQLGERGTTAEIISMLDKTRG